MTRFDLPALRRPDAILRLAFLIDKGPPTDWAFRCHEVSVAIVRSEALPDGARVARGFARGIPGQHSWIVLGDPYDRESVVVDPTYEATRAGIARRDGREPKLPIRLRLGRLVGSLYFPHGYGDIWKAGKPISSGGGVVDLDREGLSRDARLFLDLLGSLDRSGWSTLFNGPMCGWPSAEIVDRAYEDERLRALIPIDVVGMLTDRNPSGLYLPGEADR